MTRSDTAATTQLGRPLRPGIDAGARATFTNTIRLRLRVPAKLRNLELVLLIFGIVIVLFAIGLVQLGALGALFPHMLELGAALGVLVIALHIVLRFTAPQADPFIVPVAFVLNGIGIAEIYRIDIAKKFTGWEGAGARQIAWTGMAIVLAMAVLLIIRNHRVLQRYRYVAMFVGIVLLLLPMLPGIGQTVNGARLWIHLGGFQFQPGELAKIALAVFFAGYLVSARDSLSMVGRKILGIRFPRARDLGPILVIWAAAMSVLIFQHDLGTALLYFGLFLVMIYVATGRISWVILGLGLFGGGADRKSVV